MSMPTSTLRSPAVQELAERADDTDRLIALFHKFDIDGNGRIDLNEIITALQNSGHQESTAFELAKATAVRFLELSDIDNSGDVSIEEFVSHITAHEHKLRQVFHDVDRDKNGKLDVDELIDACQRLGVQLSHNEAASMIKRMDEDGSADISWEEWRDFLVLSPGAQLEHIVDFWKRSVFIDIGESSGSRVEDFSKAEIQSGYWWRHLVSGGVAGCVSRTATAPLDRIKVFLQVHGKNSPLTSNGILHCLRSMVKEGGVLSLWRGNGINIIKIAPESAIKFLAYEEIKTLIKGERSRDIRIEERFLAGSAAGAISQTAIYPLEVIKTRLALRKTGEFKNSFHLISQMLQKEGPKSFFKGYVPCLIGILPYAGIDLTIYETLKRAYLRREPSEQVPVLVLLGCGTVSSTIGQLASYPLALVRTQLQASSSYHVVGGVNGGKPHGMTIQFKQIISNEGVLGLYRGIVPNFLKVAPAVSISYLVYERTREALGVKMT